MSSAVGTHFPSSPPAGPGRPAGSKAKRHTTAARMAGNRCIRPGLPFLSGNGVFIAGMVRGNGERFPPEGTRQPSPRLLHNFLHNRFQKRKKGADVSAYPLDFAGGP